MYYKEIMNEEYYYVLFPAEKKVYHVSKDRFNDLVDQLCGKLFKHVYLEREGEDTTPPVLKPLDYARTLAHYAGVGEMEREGITYTIFLPLLKECDCSPSTKEFFLILLDKYLIGEISSTEMVKIAMRRFLKLTKKLKIYDVNFY